MKKKNQQQRLFHWSSRFSRSLTRNPRSETARLSSEKYLSRSWGVFEREWLCRMEVELRRMRKLRQYST